MLFLFGSPSKKSQEFEYAIAEKTKTNQLELELRDSFSTTFITFVQSVGSSREII